MRLQCVRVDPPDFAWLVYISNKEEDQEVWHGWNTSQVSGHGCHRAPRMSSVQQDKHLIPSVRSFHSGVP